MRLQIISDGTAAGIKIVDADTGEELENVLKASWTAKGWKPQASCELLLTRVPVVVIGQGHPSLFLSRLRDAWRRIWIRLGFSANDQTAVS